MRANFAEALQAVLKHEGGFSHHPKDPGGMTNLGCTKAVWEQHCGHEVSEKVMRALTPADVAPLYQSKYWDKVKGNDLPSGVDYVVFDCAINSGPGRAIKLLQACLGVEQDGGIGPKTLAALKGFYPEEIIKDYSERRIAFLMALSTWGTFGKGWVRRVDEVEKTALKMI